MFEKKRGTRFLASVMALVMLLSLAPVGALAAKGGNDNESYDTQDTFNIEGVETYYPLSGESNSGFTEARYIWEKDNTVYLAFTVSDGKGNGTGNSKPILSATASGQNLTVESVLYKNLQFGSSELIPATGKNDEETRWQIATYEGSIQSRLNTGNTLTISTQHQGNGYNLNGVEYTVEDYPDPSEPGEDGGTPGGSDSDGDQQETKDTVKVTYNANFEDATIEYKVPAETSVPTGADVTISKWTQGEQAVAVEDSAVTATKDGETYEFKGWSTTQSEPAGGLYVAGSELEVTTNITLYAIWEEKEEEQPAPNPPTDHDTGLVDAMYFVLMPGQGVPDSGVSQGVDKYFPNASNNGGVEGRNNTTGYVGKITKTATELEGAQTTNGYFKVNGVDPDGEYLKNIGDLGYFNADNYNADRTYKGTLPTGMANFNMTKKSIVWYVIKKEGNGYHVDGYVKGVPITLTYHENFGTSNAQTVIDKNSSGAKLNSGDKVTIECYEQVFTGEATQHQDWTFAGWFTANDQEYEQKETTLIDSVDLYAKWTNTYSVVTHFMGANGIEQENLRQTRNDLTGTHGKLLSELVVQPNITGNYVYAPSETKYSVGNEDKGSVANVTFTEANTVIHQYYYLDETGKIGKDEENKPTDKPDGIPDAWQYKVTFQVVNGSWNDKTNEAIVKYVTKKDAAGKDSATGTATLADVPAVGNEPNSGYRASGSWDKSLSVGLEIKGDTEFTFTYSRRSSGGSSRPSTPPTVDIPDDVPTGLNGKDHYAYIIGYGNNDVRPQNNITRAEVATIFFRLLTDETREANMTKSNSYNDVKDGDWFCCAVSTLSKMGIIKGYEDGSFKPNDPISRAEFAAIAARFDPDGDKTPASFFDLTSHWAKDEISIAANHGWIKGYEDGSFKPDQKITRAETMTLVNRVLNRLPETKDDLHKDMKTWVDNMDETAWYYLAVQEATNSHYFKNKTSTKFEQWTDLRDTRDWSELEK